MNCASRVDRFARPRRRGPDVVGPANFKKHAVGALPYIILARRPDLRGREANADEGAASHGLPTNRGSLTAATNALESFL